MISSDPSELDLLRWEWEGGTPGTRLERESEAREKPDVPHGDTPLGGRLLSGPT
jgi:hypothetical protein